MSLSWGWVLLGRGVGDELVCCIWFSLGWLGDLSLLVGDAFVCS